MLSAIVSSGWIGGVGRNLSGGAHRPPQQKGGDGQGQHQDDAVEQVQLQAEFFLFHLGCSFQGIQIDILDVFGKNLAGKALPENFRGPPAHAV